MSVSDADLIDAIAAVICQNEFGSSPDRWERLLSAAEAWEGSFSWWTVIRLRRTAEKVVNKQLEVFRA